MPKNPLRIDPTRTIALRRAFTAAVRRRFMAVAAACTRTIGRANAAGLPVPAVPVLHAEGDDAGEVGAGAWAWLTDAGKVEAFVTWLKKQIDDKILEPVGIIDENWTTGFIRPAYQKGVIRAYTDTLPPAAARNRPFYAGGRATFLHEAFNSPVAVEKLRLIFTRDFEGLKGITADMSAKLGRILADGIARGRHPYDVARDMSKEIDGISRRRAEVLARTEIIHAHAEGQLDAMERLGLEEVKLMAEWVTAGDDRVCPLCAEKEGLVLPIKEAHGLIPLHPQCRCSWLPIVTEASRRRAFRAAPPPELAGATE